MIANLYKTLRQPAGHAGKPPSSVEKLAACLMPLRSKQRSDWTVEQLNIQPYQHILEVGYGSGYILQEVARQLKVGFLAGIDRSISMYRQAYRRNKRFIQQQLLQLHIGDLNELSYPPHYFHSIYGSDQSYLEDPQPEFIRLSGLLKSRGKLVMVFQPRGARGEEAILQAGERIREDYRAAGLTGIRIEYRDMYPVTCIAAVGIKP